jgi:DNA-binding CsgD family transcriptional regulator
MFAEVVYAAFYAGDTAAMRAAADRAVEVAGDTPSFFASIAHGMAAVFDGRGGSESIRTAVEALDASSELRDDPRLLVWAASGALWLREAEAGRALIERAAEVAREHSAIGVLSNVLHHLARDDWGAGRWRSAAADYDEAIRLARETGQRIDLAAALAGLAWLEARQGREAECRAHAAEGQALCEKLGMVLFDGWCLAALGELAAGLGRTDEAVERFEELDRHLRESSIADVDLSPAPELVEAYVRLGRAESAVEAAGEYARAAETKGQPWALARAARCRGLLSEAFEQDFEEALALHARTPDVFETARTQLSYGARLRRARERVRAREQLRRAHETFSELGAQPWVELARAELAATGETARRRDPSTIDELTPQELQVALLLAEGRTTREAAAALFLSPKTVEYHLRHVYRKLGIASREALAAAFARAPST